MWESFIAKRGTLHVGMRLEQGFAMLASLIRQAVGDKTARMADHMPHFDKPEEAELSLEQAMRLFK